MSQTSTPSIRFSRNCRPLPELTDRQALLAYVAKPSFDLVVAERAAAGPWPPLLPRDHDYGDGAQACELDAGLYVFELFDRQGARRTAMLTSADEVVEAFADWAAATPGWQNRHHWTDE